MVSWSIVLAANFGVITRIRIVEGTFDYMLTEFLLRAMPFEPPSDDGNRL